MYKLSSIIQKLEECSDMTVLKVNYLAGRFAPLACVAGWIGLRAAEGITLKAGNSRSIPPDVDIVLPEGNAFHAALRSSIFKKYGVLQTNSIGAADGNQPSRPVYAVLGVTAPENLCTCQFRIVESCSPLRFTVVDHLEGLKQGRFGSMVK